MRTTRRCLCSLLRSQLRTSAGIILANCCEKLQVLSLKLGVVVSLVHHFDTEIDKRHIKTL